MEVFANVNNLLDRDPPLVMGEVGGLFASGNQYSTTYDGQGRRYTLGFEVKFWTASPGAGRLRRGAT